MLGLAALGTTAGWLWVSLFAIGNGGSFAMLLTLPVDLCEEAGTVADVAMWMLGLGYVVAAGGPLAIGALRDLTGGFEAALAILAAASTVTAVLALCLPRRIAADEVTRG